MRTPCCSHLSTTASNLHIVSSAVFVSKCWKFRSAFCGVDFPISDFLANFYWCLFHIAMGSSRTNVTASSRESDMDSTRRHAALLKSSSYASYLSASIFAVAMSAGDGSSSSRECASGRAGRRRRSLTRSQACSRVVFPSVYLTIMCNCLYWADCSSPWIASLQMGRLWYHVEYSFLVISIVSECDVLLMTSTYLHE